MLRCDSCAAGIFLESARLCSWQSPVIALGMTERSRPFALSRRKHSGMHSGKRQLAALSAIRG